MAEQGFPNPAFLGRRMGTEGNLLRWLGNKANGRLLLHDIEEGQKKLMAEEDGRPRGLVAAAGRLLTVPAASLVSRVSSTSSKPSIHSSSGEGGSSDSSNDNGSSALGSALSAALKAAEEMSRQMDDPAFSNIPVPTIYYGGLPAPIPAGGLAGQQADYCPSRRA